MIISEALAKTKVCPILEARSHFRVAGSERQTCIGSPCMLWQPMIDGGKPIEEQVPMGYCALRREPKQP